MNQRSNCTQCGERDDCQTLVEFEFPETESGRSYEHVLCLRCFEIVNMASGPVHEFNPPVSDGRTRLIQIEGEDE